MGSRDGFSVPPWPVPGLDNGRQSCVPDLQGGSTLGAGAGAADAVVFKPPVLALLIAARFTAGRLMWRKVIVADIDVTGRLPWWYFETNRRWLLNARLSISRRRVPSHPE